MRTQRGCAPSSTCACRYTAASGSGRMPCADIADTIVQTARSTLSRAIETVQSNPKSVLPFGTSSNPPKRGAAGGGFLCENWGVCAGGTRAFCTATQIPCLCISPAAPSPRPLKSAVRFKTQLLFRTPRQSLSNSKRCKKPFSSCWARTFAERGVYRHRRILPFARRDCGSLLSLQVFLPCCLVSKKRYVGYAYSSPDAYPVFDAKVRRPLWGVCGPASRAMAYRHRVSVYKYSCRELKPFVATSAAPRVP